MSRVVILGGGESGIGAAVLAKCKGFTPFLSDINTIPNEGRELLEKYSIEYEEGKHSREKILNSTLVIKSPGIPDTVPIVEEILEAGISVVSEIEFAAQFDKAKKICITGSNGKTTTASIIYYLLKNAGLNVGLAGNIGQSYAYQVATCNYDYYVLELSSFQLDNIYNFRADIAVLLNITPDHLDRYNNEMERYIKAKFRITENLTSEQYFIFCADDEITISHLDKIVTTAKQLSFSQKEEVKAGAYLKEEQLVVKYNQEECIIAISDLALPGKHNIYNSMAAAVTAKVLQIDNQLIRESLMSFMGVEHRMEKLIKVRDVLYINDSKSTNVNSTWYALESVEGELIWIAGGVDKGGSYEPLYKLVEKKVKALILLGRDNTIMREAFKERVPQLYESDSMEEAVDIAYHLAKPGESVLLSPAAASFNLFKNYEERGARFKRAVSNL